MNSMQGRSFAWMSCGTELVQEHAGRRRVRSADTCSGREARALRKLSSPSMVPIVDLQISNITRIRRHRPHNWLFVFDSSWDSTCRNLASALLVNSTVLSADLCDECHAPLSCLQKEVCCSQSLHSMQIAPWKQLLHQRLDHCKDHLVARLLITHIYQLLPCHVPLHIVHKQL